LSSRGGELFVLHGVTADPNLRFDLVDDPPPRPPPHGVPGPYTNEPCDDVDPIPDYENVLTN